MLGMDVLLCIWTWTEDLDFEKWKHFHEVMKYIYLSLGGNECSMVSVGRLRVLIFDEWRTTRHRAHLRLRLRSTTEDQTKISA